MVRVADYIIDAVQKAGANHIFMVTGRGVLQLTDAVAKNKEVKGISTLHEQGASYTAMAYAKTSGRVGACLVSTGCAAANAVTGCLCAYQDSLPVVFISGQHSLNETVHYTGAKIRTFGSQEADVIGLVKSITKYAVMLADPSQVVYEVEKAIYMATHGRKGPVWIDVPLDIQSARIEPDKQKHYEGNEAVVHATAKEVEIVVERLEKAERPLILVGGGCYGCGEKIKNISERCRVPVAYTYSGCDIYGSGNPLSIGAVNSLGAPRAGNFVFQNADFILAIGSRLCSQTVGGDAKMAARCADIAVVDIDAEEHTKKGIDISLFIHSDAGSFLDALSDRVGTLNCGEWVSRCLHWKEIFDVETEEFIADDSESGRIDLYRFAAEIGRILPEDAAVITDAGLEELIIPSTIPFQEGQKCLFPASQGAMGYAIPAIIGAYFGGAGNIVAIVGDGSAMMNIQELQLLLYHGIPARIFVINNNMYSVIRSRQRDLFRTRTIGNDPNDGVPMPDFKALAGAFGLKYRIITCADGLEASLADVMGEPGAVLCEVLCKTEQRYFHTSIRRNKKGKLVRTSLEDMSPFMSRELLEKEMVIDVID